MITDASGMTLACTRPAFKRLCGRPAVCADPQMCASCLPGALGVSARRLNYWATLGHVRPVNQHGTGTAWEWPPAEVEIARRMGVLTAAGLPLEWSAKFARDSWPAGMLAPRIRIEVEL